MQPPSHGEHTGWRASDYPSGHGARSLGNIGGEGGLSDSTCDVAGQQERPYISG